MGTSSSERWLGTPLKFVGVRGHGHYETSFISRWSKDWTQKQIHRFQIKRKINEFVFYHFCYIYRRCSWQHGNGNNWFTMQRWLKRKYENSGLFFLFIPNILTRTLFQQFIHTPWKWFPSLELSTYASGFFKAWRMLNPKQRAQTTNIHLENWLRISTWRIKADMDRLLGEREERKKNTAKYLTNDEHFLCL